MLSDTQKQKIYNALAEIYIDLIVQKKIGAMEQRQIAKKVLEYVEKAENYNDILVFVDKLTSIYPALKIVQARLRDDVNKVHEQAVIGQLQSYFKSASKTDNH